MDTASKLNIFLVLALLASWAYFFWKFRRKNAKEPVLPPPPEKKPAEKLPENLFNALEEGVVIFREDGEILFLNTKAFNFLGLSNQNSLPNLFEVLRSEELEKAVQEKKYFSFERELFWPTHRNFKISYVPLENDLGALILQDLTPFRRLSHIRRDFIAHLAHEFRTPLTAIEGYAETLIEDVPEEFQYDLLIILKNAKRLGRLLKELQVLSRLELQGIPQDDFDYVDLKEVIQTAIETVFIKAEEKSISLNWIPPRKPTLVWGSFDDLLRALINLLDNAIKFSPPETVVSVILEDKGNEWQIVVQDQGPGIRDSEKDRIFERFYRGKDVKEAGTGLGLAIVKHIIQAHQGKIKVESDLGQGSKFIISLPKKEKI
ncbi:sensor histidine kinase [Thermodesulfatator atlanticus]